MIVCRGVVKTYSFKVIVAKAKFYNFFSSRIYLSSILPKNRAGPVDNLISDFFGMPKSWHNRVLIILKSHSQRGTVIGMPLQPDKDFAFRIMFSSFGKMKNFKTIQPIYLRKSNGLCCLKKNKY